MMSKIVAFLRAINVGGRSVKMDDLRALFAELGFADAQTFIQSGNVIFTSDQSRVELEDQIEAVLAENLGYKVPTFIRTADELRALAKASLFPASELEAGGSTYVSFLKTEPDKVAQDHLQKLANPVDSFIVAGADVHWLRRRQLGDSRVTNGHLEKALGMPATRRNTNTIVRIANKL
jgi:uncharacterized protein (DUF1697 family)